MHKLNLENSPRAYSQKKREKERGGEGRGAVVLVVLVVAHPPCNTIDRPTQNDHKHPISPVGRGGMDSDGQGHAKAWGELSATERVSDKSATDAAAVAAASMACPSVLFLSVSLWVSLSPARSPSLPLASPQASGTPSSRAARDICRSVD